MAVKSLNVRCPGIDVDDSCRRPGGDGIPLAIMVAAAANSRALASISAALSEKNAPFPVLSLKSLFTIFDKLPFNGLEWGLI